MTDIVPASIYRAALWLVVLLPATVVAQERGSRASDVFKRFAPYVEKIQVVEQGSGAKATIGSGFYVSDSGHIVTNYHVIANLINRPDRYRAELVAADGSTRPAKVLAIDVIHDLAVLQTSVRGKPFFALGPVTTVQGERLFSLGHPRDLGLSIVEGTYNGLLEHTLYPRIHLTAPLNPGMSGGPTIDEHGRVIGINVSTEGNEVSFLVPVERAYDLLRSAQSRDTANAPSLVLIARQLRQHQDTYLHDMFGDSSRTIAFGPFRVPTQPAPFFRCWGDASRDERLPYATSQHQCSTEDDIFLDEDQTTGSLTVTHRLITTKTLNAPRFFSLYAGTFSRDNAPSGEEEYVTNWECVTRNVRNGATRMRSALCLRRYRKLGELYDAHLKAAVLGGTGVGLVSTLNLTGVTFENATALSERFLKQITWR